MTVRDVADYLNVDEKTVYRLVQRRELPAFKVAGTWRFKREEIDGWIEAARDGSVTRSRSAPRVRALLVEDDEVDRAAFRRAVRAADPLGVVDIEEVSTLAAARAALRGAAWDCVIVDRRLPDGDGLALLEGHDDLLGQAAVVVLTGVEDEGIAQTALRQGAQDYLIKGRIEGTTLMRSLRYAMERRNFDEQRRRSETNFRGLIEHHPDAVCVVRDGLVTYANPSFRQLLGYDDPEQVVGVPVLALAHPEDAERLARLLAPGTPSAGTAALLELRFGSPGGDWLLVEAWSRSVTFDGAEALLVSARDVSRRRHLEEQVVFSSRMAAVGTLAAGVAHQINNPLAYVVANVDYALGELRDLRARLAQPPIGLDPAASAQAQTRQADEVLEALAEAQQGVSRVKYIVRDLKLLARPTDSREAAMPLRQVVEWSIGVVWNEVRHRARLIKDFRASPVVFGNEAKLAQIVMNLVVNAAHAIGDGNVAGNEIRIVIDRISDETALLEVGDTGCGIPPQHLERIFDPFFTTKPTGLGTGLGLAVCHGIVTSLGGSIAVASDVGRGTTFRVSLPIAPEATIAENASAARDTPSDRPRGRVLIVDDDRLVANALSRGLSRDHDISIASGGAEALARLSSGVSFDVILYDLMMPDLNGIDLFHELRGRAPDIAERIIFITGGAFTPRARQFLESVSNRCLEKPIDMRALAAIVRERVA
jgi:excisionase family DNA binding protein/PAS domain S-box-containing protein